MICKPKRSTSYVVTNMITTSHFEPKKHKPKSSHAFGKNRALPYHHPIPSSTHQSLAFHPPPGDKGDVLRKPKFRRKKDHQEEGRYLPSLKLTEPHVAPEKIPYFEGNIVFNNYFSGANC